METKEKKRKERKGKKRKGKERKGKERKGKEKKGKVRPWLHLVETKEQGAILSQKRHARE